MEPIAYRRLMLRAAGGEGDRGQQCLGGEDSCLNFQVPGNTNPVSLECASPIYARGSFLI